MYNKDKANSIDKYFKERIKEMNKSLLTGVKSDELPYKVKPLFSNAERQFYLYMSNNLIFNEKIIIAPKVRLGDLADVVNESLVNKDSFYKIAYKHVDYVILDRDTLDVICVVELNDFTHMTDKGSDRDKFVYSVLDRVGIKFVRIDTPVADVNKSTLELIEFYIAEHFSPKCPYCKSHMTVHKSYNARNYGHRFWGCDNYPKCCYTIDIDQDRGILFNEA